MTGFIDIAQLRQERQKEEDKKNRLEDFMNTLKVAFNKLITNKINEESYDHQKQELKLKDYIKNR